MSNFKKYVKLLEGGFWGQGPSVNGSPTFQGTFYGFGGEKQLATTVTPAVRKMKKLEDQDKNIDHNTNTSSEPWPAGNKTSGFTGGEGGGIRSASKFPDTVSRIAFSAKEIEAELKSSPEKEYWGFNSDLDEPLEEQLGGTGLGAQRGSPSDQNYRHGQGYPRHSSIVKQVKHVPKDASDIDGNGEEDVYLTDEEYIDGVLQTYSLNERTLYHGTSNEYIDSIKKYGLTGELGDFVKDAYGQDYDHMSEDEIEDMLGGITFAADRSNLAGAVTAMKYHIGKKINKHIAEITEEDIRAHGMIVLIKDVEEGEWQHRPKNDDGNSEIYKPSVEPGDWYIEGGTQIDGTLTGNKLINFLRNANVLDTLKDKKRNLIKLALKFHGLGEKNKIIDWAKGLSEPAVNKQIRKYSAFNQELQAKAKTAKTEKTRNNTSDKQLSFSFEGKYKLKNAFLEIFTSPSYGPEPDRGTEQYKRGKWVDAPRGDDWLIKPEDFSSGHSGLDAQDETPGGMAMGQVASPKKFVPDDWEQRHKNTKKIPTGKE